MAELRVDVSARLANGIYRAGQIDALREMADKLEAMEDPTMTTTDYVGHAFHSGLKSAARVLREKAADLEGEQDG